MRISTRSPNVHDCFPQHVASVFVPLEAVGEDGEAVDAGAIGGGEDGVFWHTLKTVELQVPSAPQGKAPTMLHPCAFQYAPFHA